MNSSATAELAVDNPERLVGRGFLVENILRTLSDPHIFGAIVVGEPGLGKTALARMLAFQLTTGVKVLEIRARLSLRMVPFGALAPYLTSLSVADAGSPIAIYRSLTAHLGAQADDGSLPLFIVDDAQELDDSTCVLLAQMVASRRAKVLVFSRTTPGPPSEFLSLWHDGLLHRYDLGPLNKQEIHELCTRELGEEILSSVSAVLARTSAGNPMFLLALLNPATRDKYLVQRNGVWCLSGERPGINLRLTDLIQSQLRGRSTAESAVLETVALAEPVALEVLRRCCDEDAVNTLLDDQLIGLGGGDDSKVSLGHPLYGEVIRTQVPIGRSLAIRRQVLQLTDYRSDSIEEFLRRVSWGLDCGVALEDATLLRAAIVANRLYNPEFALRAARGVRAPDLKSRALVEIARARMTRGDYAYARELVDEALLGCGSLRLAKDATLLSVDLRMREGSRPSDIRSDVSRWQAVVNDIERERGGISTRHFDISRLGCRLLSCFALNLEGRYLEAEAELRPILADGQGTDETRLAALSLLGESLCSTGRPVQGAAATQEALAIIARTGHTFLGHREFVLTRHGSSLTHAGRWEETGTLLQEYSQSTDGGLVYFGGVLEFADGLTALRQGRMRTARKRLVLAVEGFRESDITQLLPMATGLAAYACAMSGDSAGARRYVSDYNSLPPNGPMQSRLMGKIHAVAGNSIFSGAANSIVELKGIAADAQQAGMSTLAACALELAVRLGDSGSLERLQNITADFDGGEGKVLNAMATAMRARNPAALEAAAHQATDAGYLLIGAECLGMAVTLLADQHQVQQSRTVQQSLNLVVERLEGLQSQHFSESQSATKLTQREQDIVTLASRGYSNRDIAAQHGVSVRTVEGHLYRIFAKLGISRREDLQGLGIS